MKTATVKEIKEELNYRTQKELIDFCLTLSKFKKENKELLTYLLFEVGDEEAFISGVKEEISTSYEQINTKSYFYIRKSVRKILRNTKKYIRYSKKKETEVELLLFFCQELRNMKPSYKNNVTLKNIFTRQINLVKKITSTLHEDLQYDYDREISVLETG